MTARFDESPLALVLRAAGSPAAMAAKLARLARGLATYSRGDALADRIARLERLGYVPRVPTRLQIVVGSIDMLRFWIAPAAAEYYESKNLHFGFHQFLRVLDDPTSMIDPTGLLSERDTIIGHLMQVVHANPAYDLQLLESHEEGLAELERQLVEMLAGTHPRAASIGAIVEEPDYHARLLDYVRAYRAQPDADAPLRDNVGSPRWRHIEQTFGTLPRAIAYFTTMPTSLAGAIRHLATVHELSA